MDHGQMNILRSWMERTGRQLDRQYVLQEKTNDLLQAILDELRKNDQ